MFTFCSFISIFLHLFERSHTQSSFFTVDIVDANETFQIDNVDNRRSEYDFIDQSHFSSLSLRTPISSKWIKRKHRNISNLLSSEVIVIERNIKIRQNQRKHLKLK